MGLLDKLTRKKTAKVADKEATPVKTGAIKAKKAAPAKKAVTAKKTAKPAEVKKAASKPVKAEKTPIAYRILLKPVLTEKSYRLQAANTYTFIVAQSANKGSVRQAIQSLYGVKPEKVRMINNFTKVVKRWGKEIGVRKSEKKAIVTVPKGSTLTLTE